MIPLATLRELYDYNYWARDRQLEACAALTQEQFLRPMGSSFPSVRDTLAHILGAELVWSGRWRGLSDAETFGVEKVPDLQEFIRRWPQQFSSLEVITERWRKVEQDVRGHLGELKEDLLLQPLTYKNFLGQTRSYPKWRALLHVVIHCSYHRGQVTTLLRQLDSPAAQVDYLVAYDQGILGH